MTGLKSQLFEKKKTAILIGITDFLKTGFMCGEMKCDHVRASAELKGKDVRLTLALMLVAEQRPVWIVTA